MVISLLVPLLISLVASENVTVKVTVQQVDSCTSTVLNGLKYVAHETDPRKYIECVGLGLGVDRTCVAGSVFDAAKVGCVLDEASLLESDNSTTSTSTVETTTAFNLTNQLKEPSLNTTPVATRVQDLNNT